MRTLLVDGDAYIHKIAWVYQGVDNVSSDARKMEESIVSLGDYIEKARLRSGCDDVIYCLGAPSSSYFRKEQYPPYKAQRKDVKRADLVPHLRAWAETQTFKMKPQLEGDDVLGILQTKMVNTVILSTDKDMLQIPGLHYKNSEMKYVSVEDADRFFWTQILTGDTSDGYPGCPGIGAKRAEALLVGITDSAEAWRVIVGAYEAKGLTEGDALVQARCARILRAEDWDFKRDTFKLWGL